jgi:parallel beta-helix repeat protein
MSGVYTLGSSEGTEVSDNHIHHIYAYDYGGWGLYTDEGSSNIVMENNLVHHTKTGGFHQHYGKENILRNNIFAFSKMYQLQATRVEDHLSFTFTNNIVIYDTGVLFQGPWAKMKIVIDKNLYWKMDGPPEFLGKDFKSWQKYGYDLHSVIADPQFADPINDNFSLKTRKITKKIDFHPFDYSDCGVYGTEEWKLKAELPKDLITEFDKLFE